MGVLDPQQTEPADEPAESAKHIFVFRVLLMTPLSDPLPVCAPKVSDLATPDNRHRLALGLS